MNKVRIFIRYASEDYDRAIDIYRCLQADGYDPCLDRQDILPGEDWASSINRAMRDADFFLAILSENSVTKHGFIQKEIRRALDIRDEKLVSDIYFIPVRLEECERPEELREIQSVDLFAADEWDRLRKANQAGLQRRQPAPAVTRPAVFVASPSSINVAAFQQDADALIENCRQHIHKLQLRIALEGIDARVNDDKDAIATCLSETGPKPKSALDSLLTLNFQTFKKAQSVPV